MSVYPFIKAEKAEPAGNVAFACRLLEVSCAAFYAQLMPSAPLSLSSSGASA